MPTHAQLELKPKLKLTETERRHEEILNTHQAGKKLSHRHRQQQQQQQQKSDVRMANENT